jgi:DNA polymerase I-like protein with 3'-5' exonuclease and polymerase domains
MQLPRLVGPIVLDTETKDPEIKTMGPGWAFKNGHIAGISVMADNFFEYLPLRHPDTQNLDIENVYGWLNEELSREDQVKIFANAQYDVGWLDAEGVKIKGPIEDIQLQAPLLDENQYSYSLETLSLMYLKIGKKEDELAEYIMKNFNVSEDDVKLHIHRVPGHIARPYALEDVRLTKGVWLCQKKKIEDEELERVYKLECDLIPLMVAMRKQGIKVDLKKAEKKRQYFTNKFDECQTEVKHRTGFLVEKPFTNSQIVPILDHYGIKYSMTPKTKKPSITADYFESINHPTINLIQQMRYYERAKNKFVEDIFKYNRKGRIHASFHQLRMEKEDGGGLRGTVGGRFSCTDPNLQQQPNPEKNPYVAHHIRELFVPEEGEHFLSLDYSAQEPRWQAEYAYRANVTGGRAVADEYKNNPRTDYHSYVARLTGLERKPAKAINLAIVYGAGGAKICHELGLPTTWKEIRGKMVEVAGPEGEQILNKYHEKCPFVKGLIRMATARAKEQGFVRTHWGRKCRFEKVDGVYWFTHKALNRIIQGSSADQNKMAMLKMWQIGIIPLATVHDENLFSIPTIQDYIRQKECMEHAFETYVPFITDPKIGPNWGLVKELKDAA